MVSDAQVNIHLKMWQIFIYVLLWKGFKYESETSILIVITNHCSSMSNVHSSLSNCSNVTKHIVRICASVLQGLTIALYHQKLNSGKLKGPI